MNTTTKDHTFDKRLILFKKAMLLAYFTVAYNFIEGIVSLAFGVVESSLTLVGFGVDSLIETISAIGIILMVYRIRQNPDSLRTQGEILALKITGFCFYGLAVSLSALAVYNLANGIVPYNTFPGVIVSLISIVSMLWLINAKQNIGKALNSPAILADANCNRVCVYMSVALLASSGLYFMTGIPYFETLGSLGLVWFSVKEGLESFKKAKGMHACCCGRDCDGSAKVIV